jgi:transposase
MGKGSKFTDDYKREIVRLVTELGKLPAEVAADIGVTTRTIKKLIKELEIHGDDAFPGRDNLHAADEEIRKQKRRIKDLEEENSILKKLSPSSPKTGDKVPAYQGP